MTDYLELLEAENTDALLEQARRLEQALSRALLESREEGEAGAASPRAWQACAEDEIWESWESDLWRTKGAEDKHRPGGEGEPAFFAERTQMEKRENVPLLEQLLSLTRAADRVQGQGTHHVRPGENAQGSFPGQDRSGPAAMTRNRRRAQSDFAQIGQETWQRPGDTEPMRPSGASNWAEQADRAFRRDSRRYDGGFYLY